MVSYYRKAVRAVGVSLLGLALASLYSSCASNRSIVENHPLDRSLASYHSLGVDVSASNEKAQSYVSNFKVMFMKLAKKKSGFSAVAANDASKPFNGVRLKLTISDVQEGDKAARAFNMGGEAVVTVDGVLMDGMQSTELSSFQVKGTSLRTSKTTVGGFDTSMGGLMDDMVGRALTAASQQIVEYLKKHQG